jgi:hypothetical protein
MSKAKGGEVKAPTKAELKQNKKQARVEALSLLGGIVFFSVVVGIAVSRNERVKAEIDSQIKGFLETTRKALSQYQQLIQKVNSITTGIKSVTQNSNNQTTQSAVPQQLNAADKYDLLWEPIEKLVNH